MFVLWGSRIQIEVYAIMLLIESNVKGSSYRVLFRSVM